MVLLNSSSLPHRKFPHDASGGFLSSLRVRVPPFFSSRQLPNPSLRGSVAETRTTVDPLPSGPAPKILLRHPAGRSVSIRHTCSTANNFSFLAMSIHGLPQTATTAGVLTAMRRLNNRSTPTSEKFPVELFSPRPSFFQKHNRLPTPASPRPPSPSPRPSPSQAERQEARRDERRARSLLNN